MWDVLANALRSLSRKRLRTALIVSSIAIGVAMVVIVSVISSVGTAVVNTELESLGVNGLSIRAASAGLSEDDLSVIRDTHAVASAAPLMIEFGTVQLREQTQSAMICGIDAGTEQAIVLSMRHGRAITRGDVQGGSRVCMVDEALAQAMYARTNIVGKSLEVMVNGVCESFVIVGVAQTGSSLLQSLTEYIPGMVYLPYTALRDLTGDPSFDQIAVKVQADAAVADVERVLLRRLERAAGTQNGYVADNLAAQRQKLGNLMDIVVLILTIISGISLVVSGLGILTIMLVSVNERTHEIGIKKSIGASKVRILAEFLAESLVVSLIGSISGLAVGVLLSVIGIGVAGVPLILPWPTLGGVIGLSVGIGGLFGAVPAFKAAGLRPVDALRRE